MFSFHRSIYNLQNIKKVTQLASYHTYSESFIHSKPSSLPRSCFQTFSLYINSKRWYTPDKDNESNMNSNGKRLEQEIDPFLSNSTIINNPNPIKKEGQVVDMDPRHQSIISGKVDFNLQRKDLENNFGGASSVPFGDPTLENTITTVTLDDILKARQVQLTLLKNTPLQRSTHLSEIVPGNNQVYLKYESSHLTGSFKERGAIYKLASLTPEEKERGVVAASAGNHAQAVSYHASRLGIKATIVMPELTPLAKVNGTRKYGADVVLFGDSLFQSLQKATEIRDAENKVFVHPYNDDKIISGQGTLGVELMEQNPFLDAVIIPIGGGGLIAGTALALKQVNPRIKIYGVESANMPGMKLSLENRKVIDVPFIRTLADGIAVKSVGDKTLSIIKEYVDDVVTVTENEIASAVMTLLEKEKTMTEGAGACSVAALLSEKLQMKNKRVCCVLSGGNIDLSVLREIIDRGLVATGRLARVQITVPDSPGYLAKVLTLLAELGCNVSEITHERAFLNLVGSVSVLVTMQTRGIEHIEIIGKSLRKHGYHHKFISQFDDSDEY